MLLPQFGQHFIGWGSGEGGEVWGGWQRQRGKGLFKSIKRSIMYIKLRDTLLCNIWYYWKLPYNREGTQLIENTVNFGVFSTCMVLEPLLHLVEV